MYNCIHPHLKTHTKKILSKISNLLFTSCTAHINTLKYSFYRLTIKYIPLMAAELKSYDLQQMFLYLRAAQQMKAKFQSH